MTASHDERETYDPRSLNGRVHTQDDPGHSTDVKTTGTGSAEWHAAQGAGPDDWLNAAHAYATISNASRSGLPSNATPPAVHQATVTSDAASVTVSLLDDVTKRVMSTDYIDASRVRIAAEDGRVALTGTVADERSKAQIEQLVAGCDGVRGIDNQLRIERAAGDR